MITRTLYTVTALAMAAGCPSEEASLSVTTPTPR